MSRRKRSQTAKARQLTNPNRSGRDVACLPQAVGVVKRRRTKMTVKKYLKESIRVGERELSVEVGRVAKQADGSCVIRYGDTMVLCAAVGASTPREGIDFFPLTVEYREANYAAGRIPGNYFRREGRPTEKEVLTCRMIDRPVRPLFTPGYRNETQVIASVVSADPDNNPAVVAITGASCALYLSDIPLPLPSREHASGLSTGDTSSIRPTTRFASQS